MSRKLTGSVFRGAQLCLLPQGHTAYWKEQEGMGQHRDHVGWWHRTTVDPRNSLQVPEMATFCKMSLRLSSGLFPVLFMLCCMILLYIGVPIVMFSFLRKWARCTHILCVYVYTCTLLSLFKKNIYIYTYQFQLNLRDWISLNKLWRDLAE